MKKYMVVTLTDDGEQIAFFTDSPEAASDRKMDTECGMGWYSEVYERVTDEDGMEYYEFSYC